MRSENNLHQTTPIGEVDENMEQTGNFKYYQSIERDDQLPFYSNGPLNQRSESELNTYESSSKLPLIHNRGANLSNAHKGAQTSSSSVTLIRSN